MPTRRRRAATPSLQPKSRLPRARPEHCQNGKIPSARSSVGPAARPSATAPQGFSIASPRPGGSPPARLTSDLLDSATFQTPETDAIDQWFENFHRYSHAREKRWLLPLDVDFKEEQSAIEQWFKVLSEAERTAALYGLSQHSTQVQIRFFITILHKWPVPAPWLLF
ncbi:hypothetical protein EDB85DRAFT_2159176 [Lactarius pseudohatsudake]|nr:hypothetical protein EDB85DRAFT_2159176 [Lactarius pseudohatsudake]